MKCIFLLADYLVMLYNPTKENITRTIKLPVYYTGQHHDLKIRIKEGAAKSYKVTRNFEIEYTVEIPADGYTWLALE